VAGKPSENIEENIWLSVKMLRKTFGCLVKMSCWQE